MKYFTAATVLAAFGLAGCAAPPPASPAERYSRLAAAAQISAERCGAFSGGYNNVRQMRIEANKNIVTARR
jgi:hypothetical protein